jgi:hypothetical protein
MLIRAVAAVVAWAAVVGAVEWGAESAEEAPRGRVVVAAAPWAGHAPPAILPSTTVLP